MSSLATVRADLATALGVTGYTSHGHVPEQVEPPCLIVQPGDPYLSTDETTYDTTEWQLSVELYVLSAYQANEQAADDLDAMLAQVLPAVLAAGWSIASSGAPGPYNTTDWIAYGVRLNCARFVSIDTEQEQYP